MSALHAKFESCTSLIDIKNRTANDDEIVELKWYFTNNTPQNRKKIEIYRFIGDVGECINTQSAIQEKRLKKIYTATQVDDNVSIEFYNPRNIISVITGVTLENMPKTVTDNFFDVMNDGYDLNNFHHLSKGPPANNLSIINDIKNTRRVLCYFIKTLSTTDDESEYNFTDADSIYPIPTQPSLSMEISGEQSNPGHQDLHIGCYDWKQTWTSTSNGIQYLSGYDDLNVTFSVNITPGTYDIKSIEIVTNDIYPLFLSDGPNDYSISGNVVNNKAILQYTYHTPSRVGNKSSRAPLEHPYINNSGYYFPTARPILKDIYKQYSGNVGILENSYGCGNVIVQANAGITVFERPPEARFIVTPHSNNAKTRRNAFCGKSWDWSLYERGSYRESGSNDAKRHDILYGVDSLSATIFDRSISRTFPITSWSFQISTSNKSVAWYPTTTYKITADPDYWNGQDIQSSFNPITGLLWRYGDYCITSIVTAGARDKFTISTQTSTITTRYDDPNNTCNQYYEGYTTYKRGVSTSIYTNTPIYGEWNIVSSFCFPPDIDTIYKNTPCDENSEGPGYTEGKQVSTTYYSKVELHGDWYPIEGGYCVGVVTTPEPGSDPTIEPICLGSLILNNGGNKEKIYSTTEKWKKCKKTEFTYDKDGNQRSVYYDFKNYINVELVPNSPQSKWPAGYTRTRYDVITAGVPIEFDYLNNIVIEAIYIETQKQLKFITSTHPSYEWPSYEEWPDAWNEDGSRPVFNKLFDIKLNDQGFEVWYWHRHKCNKAYFEVYALNDPSNETFSIFLCSAREKYKEGSFDEGTYTFMPHIDIAWIRITKDGEVLYNGFTDNSIISGIPWK